MPRLWRTRHVLRRGRDTPDQLGREAFLNKMLIIGTCCDLLRLGRSPFLLPSRLARAVEAVSGPLIWTGRESNPRPTRIHFEGVTAILELGVPNKGEGCFEWRSLRSTGMNRIGHDPCARQRFTSLHDRPHTRTAFLLVGPRLSGAPSSYEQPSQNRDVVKSSVSWSGNHLITGTTPAFRYPLYVSRKECKTPFGSRMQELLSEAGRC